MHNFRFAKFTRLIFGFNWLVVKRKKAALRAAFLRFVWESGFML